MPDNSAIDHPATDTIPAIKAVDIAPGKSFLANGRTYRVSDSFTIGRLETVNILEEELSMFANRNSCHEVMTAAINLLNDYKPVDAGALLRNKLESDRANVRLSHYTLRICTAYINYDGEDVAYLKDEQILEKINDWSVEGLDVRPFLHFAISAYKALFDDYRKDTLNILTQARSIKEEMEQ